MEDIFSVIRRKSKPVKVGNIIIGSNNPIVLQEMTSTATEDVEKTVAQIRSLIKHGCKLVRVAVPTLEAAGAIKEIKQKVDIPIIADIHFDYLLAIKAIESGVDKLRLNPGNIGGGEKVARIVAAAKEHGIPIRVGVNSGSLRKEMIDRYGGITAEGMVESAFEEIRLLEKYGFYDIVVSLKSPDINLTVAANKLLAEKIEYPIHIGITESGTGEDGMIRSIAGIGTLLLNGIGDTLRVSLTGWDRVENLRVGQNILKNLGIPYM
ncbi:MAG: (E)-4-hydroxy-3-methylbut-2-enyl-diphosphate synthase [Spirochaetota bacterium]